MIYLEFINMQSEQRRMLGPFPYVQIRYGEIVTGADGNSVVAVASESGCWTVKGVEYTDFVVTAPLVGSDHRDKGSIERKLSGTLRGDVKTERGAILKRTMAIACHDASGEADVCLAKVDATDGQVLDGMHYNYAEKKARLEGYEPPFVCFDESELANLHRACANLSRQVMPCDENDHGLLCGVSLDVYRRVDGSTVVHVDTPDLEENADGPLLTIYLNDDTDDPLWDNRQPQESADEWICPGCSQSIEPSLVRSHRDNCDAAP